MAKVRWPHHVEVAAVKRRELGFAQPLHTRQDGSVNKSEREVGVLFHESGCPRNLARVGNVHLQTASVDIPHQAREAIVPGTELVLDFHQRADRHDPDFCC